MLCCVVMTWLAHLDTRCKHSNIKWRPNCPTASLTVILKGLSYTIMAKDENDSHMYRQCVHYFIVPLFRIPWITDSPIKGSIKSLRFLYYTNPCNHVLQVLPTTSLAYIVFPILGQVYGLEFGFRIQTGIRITTVYITHKWDFSVFLFPWLPPLKVKRL